MRRNRKKQVYAKMMPAQLTGLIVLSVTLVLVFWVVDAKCNQLGQEIRKCEQKFAALEDERVREEARWNENSTPEKLEAAMLQHGIAMVYPAPEQVVRMNAAGQPVEGQLALAKFRRGAGASGQVAKTQPK